MIDYFGLCSESATKFEHLRIGKLRIEQKEPPHTLERFLLRKAKAVFDEGGDWVSLNVKTAASQWSTLSECCLLPKQAKSTLVEFCKAFTVSKERIEWLEFMSRISSEERLFVLLSKGKERIELHDLVTIFTESQSSPLLPSAGEQVILEQICNFFFHLNLNYWSGISRKFWTKYKVCSLILCKEQSFNPTESMLRTFNSLDSNSDGFLEAKDLQNCECLSQCPLAMLQGISTGAGTMEFSQEGKVSLCQFVWLILCSKHLHKAISVDYFFRVLDSEGSGKITLQQLKSVLSYSTQSTIKLFDMLNIPLSEEITPSLLKKNPNRELFLKALIFQEGDGIQSNNANI